jgi:hypothetical protein
MKKNNQGLTPRDKLILSHIAVYEMSTFEAIHQLFFENRKVDAVKSTLRRLGEKKLDLLKSEPILGTRKVYYRLTPKGAKQIGLKNVRCGRLGDSKLPQCYAMLWFTRFDDPSANRTPCRPREFTELFSFGDYRLPKVDFYIAEEKQLGEKGPEILFGFTITDFNSDIRRIVGRAKKHLRGFLQRGWFDQLIAAQRFELAILTLSEEKKRSIDLMLNRELRRVLKRELLKFPANENGSFPIKTRVVVIPGLKDLIPGHRKLKGKK